MRHQFSFFSAFLLIALYPSPLFGQGNDEILSVSDSLLLWHPISLEEESRFLFVAFEEAAFVRERLGRWLPNRFLPIEPGDECFWALRNTALQGKKMLLHISTWNKTQNLFNDAYWSFTLNAAQRSEDAEEPRVVYLANNTGFLLNSRKPARADRFAFFRLRRLRKQKRSSPSRNPASCGIGWSLRGNGLPPCQRSCPVPGNWF